jgi:hypothetical protein
MSSTPPEVTAWRQTEITLTGTRDYANPYTDVDVWAEFTHESGTVLRRPAFWDGGRVWKVRFASPHTDGRWTWRSGGSVADEGLSGQSGALVVEVLIPPNTRAEVQLPDGQNPFEIGSGRHTFRCPYAAPAWPPTAIRHP